MDAPSQSADALAVQAFYQHYYASVWSMTRRFGVSTDAMDDNVVHEVSMVVHRELATLDHTNAIQSWLYSTVRKCASNHHVGLYPWCTETVPGDLPDLTRAESTAEFDEPGETVPQLWQLLDTLDGRNREVFIMSELGEPSCAEIAEAQDIPLNNTYSRLRHACDAFELVLTRNKAHVKGPV